MSEATLWLIYATGIVPGFALRWKRRPIWLCCLIAGLVVLGIWMAFAVADGADFSEKWTAVGIWIAFWFGAIAGLLGTCAAMWRE